MKTANIKEMMIAPCGMICAICVAHLREKKQCLGCLGPDDHKSNHCVVCRIKNCEELKVEKNHYCFSCEKYPCTRLKQLDKRYRTKYGMSMLENLKNIKETGIDSFIETQNQKWTCGQCGETICVHRDSCLKCGEKNKYFPGNT